MSVSLAPAPHQPVNKALVSLAALKALSLPVLWRRGSLLTGRALHSATTHSATISTALMVSQQVLTEERVKVKIKDVSLTFHKSFNQNTHLLTFSSSRREFSSQACCGTRLLKSLSVPSGLTSRTDTFDGETSEQRSGEEE